MTKDGDEGELDVDEQAAAPAAMMNLHAASSDAMMPLLN
jgi:hypothetical protein